MAYMRHEKVDLVSLLVRRRLSSACQKARGRETSVKETWKEKGLKTSGREDAWHWAGEKRREGAAGKAPVATREMPRGTGTGCGIEWSMPARQHGVRPVMETRTRHCFERNEWCESEQTRRGGACV